MKKIKYSKFSVILILFALLCLGDFTEAPFLGTNSIEASTAKKKSAGKKKAASTKKSGASKKKSKTSSSRKRTSSKASSKRSSNKGSKKASPKAAEKPKEVILNDPLTLLVNNEILDWMPANLNPGGLRVNSVVPYSATRSATIGLNENFTYLPVTKEFIHDLKKHVATVLPDSLSGYDLNFIVGDKGYSYYINTITKLPEQYRKNIPFVVEAEPYVKADKGMAGDIVAMWPSHGRYFKPGSSGWYWQRPQLFQVTEDTHTMSYIYPYVAPMIENAGGYVMLPRERDINRNEVIVDNDTNDEGAIYSQTTYVETNGSKRWETGEGDGFIYDIPDFRDTENPFENGTYRQVATVTGGKQSQAAWFADIPKDGEYAVYVSYKTLPQSTSDALYTVNYSGGKKQFRVNQQMGGGTWIYLGTFPLKEGEAELPVVTLSNISSKEGRIVTADAVKIGGGMGNIARSNNRSDVYYDYAESYDTYYTDPDNMPAVEDGYYSQQTPVKNGPSPYFSTSGLPRYLEGARYWLHWAGMPEEVYSPYHGTDDYKDDYTSRGLWVNYLAGGSRVLPNRDGLKIPVDISMALHSDAGKKADDSFIGTLGIYFTNNGADYIDGTPRSNSRTLTDMLMRQITMDIRQSWEPNWNRRSMWDKSYVEARVPEVPTSLIEFMSHQNFADMKYAIDPAFRFTVGRAIYKAIGRFIAERKDRKFVVQPLPVKDFAIQKEKKGNYKLSWKATEDPLEPTAQPEKFIILERIGDDLGFHKIGETSNSHFTVKVSDNLIHSYKIIAANDGGVSFPSETLALREGKGSATPILIINGFDRISGPANFSQGSNAGFDSHSDFGVPYIKDIAFIGYQTEFNRNAGDAFGKSSGEFASTVIAGNTFDYPYIHGKAMSPEKGFVSASVGAVEKGMVDLSDYKIIDLILGKQKATIMGNGASGVRFQAFPEQLQTKLRKFVDKGGNLFVSGEYVVSDLYSDYAPQGSYDFAQSVLGVSLGSESKPYTGNLSSYGNTLNPSVSPSRFSFSNTLNEDYYIVENPDIIAPSGMLESGTFITFSDNSAPAALMTKKGNRKGVVMSVPFEAIDVNYQKALMKEILDYLEK